MGQTLPKDKPNGFASYEAYLGLEESTTTVNADGSITKTRASGVTEITTTTDNSMTIVYGPPINKTKTVIFTDNSISEVLT